MPPAKEMVLQYGAAEFVHLRVKASTYPFELEPREISSVETQRHTWQPLSQRLEVKIAAWSRQVSRKLHSSVLQQATAPGLLTDAVKKTQLAERPQVYAAPGRPEMNPQVLSGATNTVSTEDCLLRSSCAFGGMVGNGVVPSSRSTTLAVALGWATNRPWTAVLRAAIADRHRSMLFIVTDEEPETR
jgi:hypothetical protein